MSQFPGLGNRFADRLRVLGFWKDQRPDVGRFCREKGYRPQYVYAWLKDRMPGYDNLRRLATDLDVPVVWFVAGDTDAERRSVRATSSRDSQVHPRRGDPRRTAEAPRPIIAPHIDLGPLREATERIATLRADLEALLAAFPDPCLWIDERGVILDAHGAHDAHPLRTAGGRHITDMFTAAGASVLQRAIARALRANDIVTVECERRDRGEEARTYEARLRPVAETRPRRARKVLAVMRDVTQYKDAATQYRNIVDGSSNGLCVHVDYVIQYANRAMARMAGYDVPGELVGRDVRQLLPEHRVPKNLTVGRSAEIGSVDVAKLVKSNGEHIGVGLLTRPVSWRSRTGVLLTLAFPPARRPGQSRERASTE